jgi:hypothetical protein
MKYPNKQTEDSKCRKEERKEKEGKGNAQNTQINKQKTPNVKRR